MLNKLKTLINKHPTLTVLTVLVSIIVLVVVGYPVILWGLINYSEKHAGDAERERIAKIIPFSQRGNPVPQTDVPVVLPPDPGEAGKKTLAGIDSNNDGVRDDLEREIVYMYPKNEEVRRVLRAMVKVQQQFITTEGDHEYFKGLRVLSSTFASCSDYLVFPKSGSYDSTNAKILSAILLNTKIRQQKDEDHQIIATPYIGSAVISRGACEEIKGKY